MLVVIVARFVNVNVDTDTDVPTANPVSVVIFGNTRSVNNDAVVFNVITPVTVVSSGIVSVLVHAPALNVNSPLMVVSAGNV